MKKQRKLLMAASAAVVPGVVTYVLFKCVFFPPVAYAVLPPDQPQGAQTTQSIVHEDAAPGTDTAKPVATALAPRPAAQPAAAPQQQPAPAGMPVAPGTVTTASVPVAKKTAAKPAARSGRPGPGRGEGMPVFSLMRVFSGASRLVSDKQNPLSAKQAKAILAVMLPLRAQKSLSPAQATTAQKKLEAVLSAAQRKTLEKEAAVRRQRMAHGGPGGFGGPMDGPGGAPMGGPGGFGGPMGGPDGAPMGGPGGGPMGGPGPGFGGPGGPGGPMGGRARMQNMNPFAANSGLPFAKRVQSVFDTLKARAQQR